MNVRAFLRCGGVLAAVVFLFGCSTKARSPLEPSSSLIDTPSGPDAASHPGGFGAFERRDISGGDRRFFPLDSGSVWIYTVEQRSVISDVSAPAETLADVGDMTTLMGGAYDFSGTPYSLSTETTRIRGDRSFDQHIFYRQDATGLYELDLPIRDPGKSARVSRIHEALGARIARETPAVRAASLRALASVETRIALVEQLLRGAGPIPATGPQGQPEIQRLAYPLIVGREWIVRADPLFTERVEARESVPVGGRRLSGWRIRIESELFGPEDRVWFWVSREGELRFRDHFVGVAVDDAGNVVGTVVSDELRQLVEYHLAGSPSGPFPTSPFGGRTTLREVATR